LLICGIWKSCSISSENPLHEAKGATNFHIRHGTCTFKLTHIYLMWVWGSSIL
jgi:hypothetical protein